MTTNKFKPLTFDPKGLTPDQYSFLLTVEELFFEGEEISLAMLEKAFMKAGFQIGCPSAPEILEAWKYWEFLQHPLDRQSLKTPRHLTNIFFDLQPKKIGGMYFWIRDNRKNKSYFATLKTIYMANMVENEVIYPLSPDHYYFEITEDGRLYIKYQQIIGSRYICNLV